MAKKKHSKLVNAAHIKRHTEGTSNELSFSVLDAKKNQADVEEGTDDKVQSPRFGGLPVFSWRPGKKRSKATPMKEPSLPLSGESSEQQMSSDALTSTPAVYNPTALESGFTFASSEDEIERRKSRRRKRRITALVFGIIAGIVLLGGGTYFLVNEMANHQEQVGVLDRSFDKINEADETILAIDQVLGEPLEERDVALMEKLITQIPDAVEQLDEGEEYATTALENMRQTSEKSVAEQTVGAIDARKQMLASSEEIMKASIQAKNDEEMMQQAWKNVLDADEITREAAALVTTTTPENVTSSKEKNTQAKGIFEEASYILDQLSTSSLSPQIETLQNYVAKRIEACGYSIASDEAILAQNRQVAEEQNAAYNTADAEASALARELPEDPLILVDQAYEDYVEDKAKQYSEMRSSASTADAFLRDYLGTSGK